MKHEALPIGPTRHADDLGTMKPMSPTHARAIEGIRRTATQLLEPSRRAALGQYMTSAEIADFMASLFTRWPHEVRVLDPGAGVGSLTEAFAERFLAHAPSGATLEATAYEVDSLLAGYLADHMREVGLRARQQDHRFTHILHERDFVNEATFLLGFAGHRYTHAILNPPYKKIGSGSAHRKALRTAGIETVNLYTAFLGLAVALTEPDGEIVAIVPRSFCNGTYFRPFRRWLLKRVAIAQIHIFESRSKAFKEDDVLQENIIVHMVRGGAQGEVIVSSSHDSSFQDFRARSVPFAEIVNPDDSEQFIHAPTSAPIRSSRHFPHTLQELGLEVSTGPVVDFRLRAHWLHEPDSGAVPLLYAHNFAGGELCWPRKHKKPAALALNDETRKWLMPCGWYVLTKRFSAKEETRRLVAFVFDPEQLASELVGFENHLNVIHARKNGLTADLAHGLALFLNSSVADHTFRSFSGHTQVNATDLRAMRYPSRDALLRFGGWARKQAALAQKQIDQYLDENGG